MRQDVVLTSSQLPMSTEMPTPKMDIYAYTYGFLVGIGGLIGFIKAGSLISLVVGTLFSFLIINAAGMVSKDPKKYHFILGLVH
jgi:uncharacterized membrane protein (UPF0136 family)